MGLKQETKSQSPEHMSSKQNLTTINVGRPPCLWYVVCWLLGLLSSPCDLREPGCGAAETAEWSQADTSSDHRAMLWSGNLM